MQAQLTGYAVGQQPDFMVLVPFCADLLDVLPEFGLAMGDGQGHQGFVRRSTWRGGVG